MPMYCFKCEKCGSKQELWRTISDRNTPVNCMSEGCGGGMERDFGSEFVASTDQEYLKPVLSDSAGVHPDQVAEETRAARKAGVDLQFTKDGRAIFRSHNHRAKCLKYLGMHDRDGY